MVALTAQVASNFANDYFDFVKGADTAGRLGPVRAVASGSISPCAMLAATFITLAATGVCGLFLLLYAGWWLLPVGLAIALCSLAYSAGPFPLAYNGLGDICVLIFYGIVPVCFTYYVQALEFSPLSLLLSLPVGLMSVNILVINNYRDYHEDLRAGKRTSIVIFGRGFGRRLYLFCGMAAFALSLPLLITVTPWMIALHAAFFVLIFLPAWRSMTISEGKALNKVLGRTALNTLLYTFLLILTIFLQ
jgi:1,4-dihydroxy-2-naphthoate octaprenyltransferase